MLTGMYVHQLHDVPQDGVPDSNQDSLMAYLKTEFRTLILLVLMHSTMGDEGMKFIKNIGPVS